jgi:hypothetical protein
MSPPEPASVVVPDCEVGEVEEVEDVDEVEEPDDPYPPPPHADNKPDIAMHSNLRFISMSSLNDVSI